MKSGIYVISSPSGRRYVGSAVNFNRRWSLHLGHLRKGTHHSAALQSAFNKYGEENLVFKKLLVCKKEDLIFYEQRTIDVLKPEYNACKVAGNTLGFRFSFESLLHKKKVHGTLEARKRNSEAQKKVQGTPTARAANSARQKIAQMRPEVRAKKSAALKGKPLSEETRRKISDSTRGKIHSIATKIKMSEAKRRPILCIEKNLSFSSVAEVCIWCKENELTKSKNPTGQINKAIQKGTPIYGFHWKEVKSDKQDKGPIEDE